MKPSASSSPVVPAGSARGFRRARCALCSLPLEVCLCERFGALSSRIELCVVMPASERRSMSNTARLLARWLPSTRLIVRGLLPSEGEPPAPLSDAVRLSEAALLFPVDLEPAGADDGAPAPLRVPSETGLDRPLAHSAIRQLVVPDGTWSQARRIARRDLQPLGLPRLALDRAWPSSYELRRRPSGLCTFEAVAIALGLLDSHELAARLLERFTIWNGYQLQLKRGRSLSAPPELPAPHPALGRLLAITQGRSSPAD